MVRVLGSSFAFRDLSCSYETLPAHVALGAALEVEPQAQPLQTADEAVVAHRAHQLLQLVQVERRDEGLGDRRAEAVLPLAQKDAHGGGVGFVASSAPESSEVDFVKFYKIGC